MKFSMRVFAASALLALIATPSLAQTGFPPYGSFQPGGFDIIDRQNLNFNFGLPIVSIPARGVNFQFAINYNSVEWNKGGTWYPSYDGNGNPFWGWNLTNVTGYLSYTSYDDYCADADLDATGYYGYYYTDALGTVHPFNIEFFSRGPFHGMCTWWNTTPKTGYATDGSGYYMDATNATAPFVITPSGVRIDFGGKLTDRNGNYITPTVVSSSETDWTDTAGHAALKIRSKTGTSNCTDGTNTWPACIEYEYQDTTGTARVIKLFLQTYNVQSNFGCSGVGEYSQTGVNLPDKLLLVNGASYSFTYEPSTSGNISARLKRVTLPTGGYYEYQYPTTGNMGVTCVDGSIVSLTRVVNDGTTSNTWNYSRAQSGSNWVTTVSAPTMPYDSVGNDSVFTFNSGGQETSEQFYQGSSVSGGTLLKTVNTTWSGSPTSRTVILPNGGGSLQSKTETSFDSFGNLTQLKEHDWGSGAPGSVLRTTNWTFSAIGNIQNLYTEKTISDSAGTIKYREDIAYDQTGYDNQSCPASAPQHDDTNFGCSFTTRGNPTSITTYTNASTPSGGITTNFKYDWFGNVLTTLVAGTQQSSITYSSTYNYAYPTQIVRGPSGGTQLTTSATFNAYTGQIASFTDANSQTTSFAYDSLKRQTSFTRPDSTQITTAYDDTNLIVTTTTPVTSSASSVGKVYFDGLSRPTKSKLLDGSSNVYSIVDTVYDPVGRAYRTSNPYISSPSYWTEVRFDSLSRLLYRIRPDGSQKSVSYTGDCATATDQASKARKSCFDGLGHMTQVFEDPSSLNYETDYTYSVLNSLTLVSQGSQTRSFTYDGTGRVTQSITPEAGTFQYQYNSFNQITQRTDARGVITTYGYDTLNRLTSVSYNVGSTGVPATPTVSYTYDQGGSAAYALGRLTTMTDGTGSETYSYDQLGRTTQLAKVIGSTTYTTSYAYNLGNELTSITYPSGRVMAQSYDSAGRLCAVGVSGSSCSSGARYTYAYSYNAAQQVTGLSYGYGVAATFGYSADRLQLTSLSYTKSGTTLFSLSYGYTSGQGNNGQITNITDNVDGGRSASYAYDSLARLSTAATSGSSGYPAWGLSMTYDRYGNRTLQNVTAGSAPYNSVSVDPTTNRINTSGYSYDFNGNMTNDGANSLLYDAENHLVSVGAGNANYYYDGNNLRVKKVNGSTTTAYIFSGSKVIAEYDNGAAPSSPTREYLYAGGTLIATYSGGNTYYHHQDHLSVRISTDSSGNIAGQQGHFPFGESWYASSTTTKYQFTTYERDSESGNDYALARYHVNRLGRFSSPDPLAGRLANPQSLNRYTYALNDPVGLIDPSGQWHCHWSDGTDDDPPSEGGATFEECRDGDPDYEWRSDPGDFGGIRLMDAGTLDQAVSFELPPPDGRTDPDAPAPPEDPNDPYFDDTILGPEMDIWHNTTLCPTCGDTWDVTYGAATTMTVGYAVALTAGVGGAAVGPALLATGTGYVAALAGPSGVVIGLHPEYLDAAEELGLNALNLPTTLYNTLNAMGEAWTANQAFLQMSTWTGQQFYLAGPALSWGTTLSVEIQFLAQQGISAWDIILIPH